jgi:fructose-1,6-bisphosphatase II
MGNAVAVIAVAERGAMFDPGPAVYMDKIAVGPEAIDVIDIEAGPEENISRVAKAKGMRPEDVSVVVLERDRHEELVKRIRNAGAKVMLITDGDVQGAIVAAAPERQAADMLMGIGGTPEGVVAAAALKCLGGEMQGTLYPRNDEERNALVDSGYDLSRVLTTDDLCGGEEVFFAATGVTTGAMLRGVRYRKAAVITSSIVMRSKSGTIRYVDGHHQIEKLMRFSRIEYR